MRLTAKEEKIARLALDKGAQPGERDAAAIKLINSLHARGVTVEDIEKVTKIKVATPSPPQTAVRKPPSAAPPPTVVRKPPSPAPPPREVRKAPSPASQSAYTAPEQTLETAEENVPVWRQVAVLLSVIIGVILLFVGLGKGPPRDSASAQSLPSPEQVASAQLSSLPEQTSLAQVSPSPEPTVRRAQLVSPKETHSRVHGIAFRLRVMASYPVKALKQIACQPFRFAACACLQVLTRGMGASGLLYETLSVRISDLAHLQALSKTIALTRTLF